MILVVALWAALRGLRDAWRRLWAEEDEVWEPFLDGPEG